MSIKMQVGKPYLQTEIEPKRITGNLSRRIQLPQDYNDLTNKPSINEIELVGDLSLDDLGIASAGSVEELSEAIEGKQDTLTFDSVPTQNSQNPVQSGGVYDALTGKQDAGDYAAAAAGDTAAIRTASIPFGKVDATSTSTAYTATVPGITSLYDGVACYLMNGVVTSASGFTIDINGLGALPVYSTLAAASRSTTLFNVNYTLLLVYNSQRVEGGCWDAYYGYDSNTNTIGYQVRTNSSSLPASDKFYRYRLLFTSADGTKWVPANTSTSTNATAARTVNSRPIDPHGAIVYYGTTTAIEADALVTAAQIWQQYTLTLGYSFNRTGAALDLPYPKPIYVKCTPQADGSAVIDPDDPYVTALPTTDDGKIYIFLGRTYSATSIELTLNHPVYHYKNGAIRLWTGPV